MAKNVHVIPHMHWDREWYFTTEESRIFLVNNMEEILTMLETNPNYPYYILDGQTAILKDYFDIKPENKERVKHLVQRGKLIIGPWFTQTDEMVVGGESIVRNLFYGLKDCEEFGKAMMIGYLPDSFGQSEKMPQILNGFNIYHSVFWRGITERHGTDRHNFFWETNGQGKVLAHLLPLGYAIGKYLPQDEDKLKKRMDKYFSVLDHEKGDIVLPNGHDQMPIQRDIFDVMKALSNLYPDKNFFLSKFEDFFENLDKSDLDTVKGEFLDGKYMRVHRSIFSTRADLKSSNTRIENKITNILEPLASIAHKLGFEYHHGLIEAIWKELLQNHAHDSIACCCSDKTHKYIENRFFVCEDKTDELIKFYKRKITDSMPNEKDKLTIFNLLPYKRKEVVQTEIITKYQSFEIVDSDGKNIDFEIIEKQEIDPGLIDRQIVHYGDYMPFMKYKIMLLSEVCSMGYTTYFINESKTELACSNFNSNSEKLENQFYSIEVNKNGSMNILCKETGENFKNVLIFKDEGDDGDEYDFSPLQDDFVVTSDNSVADIKIKNYTNMSQINIKHCLLIPKDLHSRKEKINDSYLDIEVKIILLKENPVIKLNIDIQNNSKDHRLRGLIPQNISAKFSVSDNQFGFIKRAVKDEMLCVWETENWDERPDSIYPMLSYVSTDNKIGLAVITNSVREYEIVGENFDTTSVTLFRSVGFLGKENLLRRPGRPSGIKMPTPDSQMLGKQSYEIALTQNSPNLEIIAKEYLTPFVCYNKTAYNAVKLNKSAICTPFNYSMFKADNSFVLSTLKKAEREDGYILRLYQSNKKISEVKIENAKHETNLNEERTINIVDGTIALERNVVKSVYML